MVSMKHFVTNLARATNGDGDFLKRWNAEWPTIDKIAYNTTILVVDQYTKVTKELTEKIPKLKYVCTATTGHTHIEYLPKGVELISIRGHKHFLRAITSVAEFTMYLLFRLAREAFPQHVKLRGKTMGIIGHGRVGKQVDEMAKGIGIKTFPFDQKHNRHYLKKIFRECDIISIHLSETKETEGFVGKNLLSLMKPTSMLINTARASILDEKCASFLLNQKEIGAIASDVSNERSPLRPKRPNVICTNHVGGRCLEDRILTDLYIIEQLKEKIQAST